MILPWFPAITTIAAVVSELYATVVAARVEAERRAFLEAEVYPYAQLNKDEKRDWTPIWMYEDEDPYDDEPEGAPWWLVELGDEDVERRFYNHKGVGSYRWSDGHQHTPHPKGELYEWDLHQTAHGEDHYLVLRPDLAPIALISAGRHDTEIYYRSDNGAIDRLYSQVWVSAAGAESLEWDLESRQGAVILAAIREMGQVHLYEPTPLLLSMALDGNDLVLEAAANGDFTAFNNKEVASALAHSLGGHYDDELVQVWLKGLSEGDISFGSESFQQDYGAWHYPKYPDVLQSSWLGAYPPEVFYNGEGSDRPLIQARKFYLFQREVPRIKGADPSQLTMLLSTETRTLRLLVKFQGLIVLEPSDSTAEFVPMWKVSAALFHDLERNPRHYSMAPDFDIRMHTEFRKMVVTGKLPRELEFFTEFVKSGPYGDELDDEAWDAAWRGPGGTWVKGSASTTAQEALEVLMEAMDPRQDLLMLETDAMLLHDAIEKALEEEGSTFTDTSIKDLAYFSREAFDQGLVQETERKPVNPEMALRKIRGFPSP